MRLCHPTPATVQQKQGNHRGTVFLLCFLHTPAERWLVTGVLARPSNMLSTVLVWKRGGRVISAYCSVTQTWPQIVNNPMEKQELKLHSAHTLLTLESSSGFWCTIMRRWAARHVHKVKLHKLMDLNGHSNYRQPRCKTSTMGANLVKSWSHTTTTGILNWLSCAGLLSVNLLVGFQTS